MLETKLPDKTLALTIFPTILNVLIKFAHNILSVIVVYGICRSLINLLLITHLQIIMIPFNCFPITKTSIYGSHVICIIFNLSKIYIFNILASIIT